MDRYISVDSGKGDTKVCILRANRIDKFSIETKMDLSDMSEAPEHDTYIVEYDGQTYKFGRGANQQAPYETTKRSNIHKVATLTAIALCCDNNDKINVAIGCPLTIYENLKQRQEYRDFMFPNGYIKIKVKTSTEVIEKTFTIGNGLVFPEGSGVMYLKMAEFQNKYIGIIDIGSLNMNGSIYNHCMMQHDFSITSADLGSHPLINGLAKALNAAYSINITPQWVDNMLKEKDRSQRFVRSKNVPDAAETSSAFISDFIEKHIEKIFEALTKAQWDICNTDLVFTGGTAGLLEEEIRNAFKKQGVDNIVIPEEPQYTNALGWLKALAMASKVKFPG